MSNTRHTKVLIICCSFVLIVNTDKEYLVANVVVIEFLYCECNMWFYVLNCLLDTTVVKFETINLLKIILIINHDIEYRIIETAQVLWA